ncbi:MAG TPA: hypothetical protein VF481_02980 [Novosphingobium sp.]
MNRILLALLALLGFAAQAAHAETGLRSVGSAQVGTVQSLAGQARVVADRTQDCAPPVMQESPRIAACLPIALTPLEWRPWTVLPGIDRARE